MKITIEIDFDNEKQAAKFIKSLATSKFCQQANDGILLKTTVKSANFDGFEVKKASSGDENHQKNALDKQFGEGVGGGERVGSATLALHQASLDAVPFPSDISKDPEPKQGKPVPPAIPAQAKRVSVPGTHVPSSLLCEPSNAGSSGIASIRTCYLGEYKRKYGNEGIWGARESGQAKYLLRQISLSESLELIPAYFDWKNSQVIKAGHPFGMGYSSFMQRFAELRADLAAPGRHAQAYAIDSQHRALSNKVSSSSNVEIAMKQLQSRAKRLES